MSLINFSMKTLNIIHLGPGKVGKTFLKYFKENRSIIEKNYQISLRLIGVFSSHLGYFNDKGIDIKIIEKIIKNDFSVLKNVRKNYLGSLINEFKPPFVIIDTTASDRTFSILESGLRRGGFVVMSNKRPLSSDLKMFNSLFSLKNRLYFETTVGAGLPIITTIRELIETGDRVVDIQGCFSGTLGYIFTLLQQEKSFSQAIIEAKEKGYTEPDPRDDLSGLDVARKALILSRFLGNNLSLKDVKLSPLYPINMNQLSTDEFLKKVNILNSNYHRLMMKAKNNNKTLRFVAKINKKTCMIGLNKVDLTSDIGSLHGPDNIAVIKTERYLKNPLVIKGPGAGLEVTATGVLGDLLKIIKIISL